MKFENIDILNADNGEVTHDPNAEKPRFLYKKADIPESTIENEQCLELKKFEPFAIFANLEILHKLTGHQMAQRLNIPYSRYRQIRYGYIRLKFIDILRIHDEFGLDLKVLVSACSKSFDRPSKGYEKVLNKERGRPKKYIGILKPKKIKSEVPTGQILSKLDRMKILA